MFGQALRMYKFHRTPFEELIGNILDVISKHEAFYTFPTVASVAAQKPELLRKIVHAKSEIAVHGYQHIKYPLVSAQTQEKDMSKAVSAYKQLGIPINGFRAPYNAYDSHTPEIVEKLGFLWDGGIGHSYENRTKSQFFKTLKDGKELNFVCVPQNELSDDSMIDHFHYSNEEMLKLLKVPINNAKASNGVVMFDFHPIRMGQARFVGIIDELIAYGKGIGGWFPTVTEAVKVKTTKGGWNGFDFCCLLTGDIDNFYFRDYLKRLT